MSGRLCLLHLSKPHDNAPLPEKQYAPQSPDSQSLGSRPRSSAAPSRGTIYPSRCAASPFAPGPLHRVTHPPPAHVRMQLLLGYVHHVASSAPTSFHL